MTAFALLVAALAALALAFVLMEFDRGENAQNNG